jgi:NAD(P)-dependent dehydrogenase (short-subunit alcohol dehydrogenase family)
MFVVITGATSGIGLHAARALLRDFAKVATGSRDPQQARTIIPRAAIERLDLADLESVRRFAGGIKDPIDALVLNAGMQVTRPTRSAQGFELTFAANHLAHHLLLRLLLPKLAPNARVILTASGTHDPAERTGMPSPTHADADLLAFPERDPAGGGNGGRGLRRAYSASKLCNIMTARELARRTAAERPDRMIAAFDPGYVPATGLARDYPALVRWIAPRVVKRIAGPERVSTPDVSGAHLAQLVTAPVYAGSRGDYWSVRNRQLVGIAPSVLARDEAACARLWDDSVRLTDRAPASVAA